MREGTNDKSNNVEMLILDEGALDKALQVSEKLYTHPPITPEKNYEVIDYEYFKQTYVNFPKELL